MKTNRILSNLGRATFIFALSTFVVACDKNNDDLGIDNTKDTPITVSAGVAELTTRAGHDNTNLPGTFYLNIDQTGEKYDYPNMVMTKGEGNAYTPASQLLWAGGTDNEVTAIAATFSLDGTQTLEAKADQSTDDAVKASDHLLMATKDVTPSADGISVEFSHIMSKVILTITLGDEFNETDNPISNVTFQGTVASNSYTVGTGWATIADDATATDIIPLENGYTPIGGTVTNATAEYEVILVPQTVAAGNFTVQFYVGERLFNWTSTTAVTLESGYKYTLGLTAGKDMVSSASFSSTAWNTGYEDSNNFSGETE